MNEALRARLRGIQDILIAHYSASLRLPNAAQGDEREIVVREFLEKVFPAPYRFGSGAVADAAGGESGQLDIVVEFPFFASFPTLAGNQRLYLAESVAFVIEVKSNLSSEWDGVGATTAKVRTLHRKWRGHLQFDPAAGVSNVRASVSEIPVVAVGFTGYKTLDTLRE